jgi:hypothetical protein
VDFEIPCGHGEDDDETRKIPDHYPLDRRGIEDMLKLAQRHQDDFVTVTRIQIRLCKAIPGMTCPLPETGDIADRAYKLDAAFVNEYQRGAAPDLVDRIAQIIGI